MESKLTEISKQKKREQEEKIGQERLRRVEEQALRVQNDLEKQEAIRRVEEDARAALHNVCQDSSSFETDEALERAAGSGQDSGDLLVPVVLAEYKPEVATPGLTESVEHGTFSDTEAAMVEMFGREHGVGDTGSVKSAIEGGDAKVLTSVTSVDNVSLAEFDERSKATVLKHKAYLDAKEAEKAVNEEVYSDISDASQTETSRIFGDGASKIMFEPGQSSTPTWEVSSKRNASIELNQESQENIIAGSDMKKMKFDLLFSFEGGGGQRDSERGDGGGGQGDIDVHEGVDLDAGGQNSQFPGGVVPCQDVVSEGSGASSGTSDDQGGGHEDDKGVDGFQNEQGEEGDVLGGGGEAVLGGGIKDGVSVPGFQVADKEGGQDEVVGGEAPGGIGGDALEDEELLDEDAKSEKVSPELDEKRVPCQDDKRDDGGWGR